MADVVELKMARLGDALSAFEEKADDEKPKGKGGKKRPLPPWLKEGDDDEKPDTDDSDDDSDDDEDKPSKKPGRGKVPPQFAKGSGKGEKAAKPGKGFRPSQREQGGDGRKPAVTARRNRTGAEVQPIAWAGGSEAGGNRRRRRGGTKSAARGAARITTWGPVNQHVDVRRGRGDGVMDQGPSDARLRRASREEDTDSFRPRRGHAAGNGVTGGRSGSEIQSNPPQRLRKGRARDDGWSPSADVGEGRRSGRSGSAMVPNKPGNLRKDLWSYDVDEVKSAMAVVQKALNGLASDLSRD